jgi:hypothetical protein
MSFIQETIAQYANKEEVIKLVQDDTRLTYVGYGHFGETSLCGLKTPDAYGHWRKELTEPNDDILRQIAFSRKWLQGIDLRKTVNKDRSSYGYKHDVENWLRKHYLNQVEMNCYISNGCFIVAAKMESLKIGGLGNPCFNISKKAVGKRYDHA